MLSLPAKTWAPLLIIILPPSPEMLPFRVPLAALIVSALLPKAVVLVVDVPVKDLILVPGESIALMLKIPLFVTPLELAMEPEPDRDKVPWLMVVAVV